MQSVKKVSFCPSISHAGGKPSLQSALIAWQVWNRAATRIPKSNDFGVSTFRSWLFALIPSQESEKHVPKRPPFAMLSDSQNKVMDLYGTHSPAYKGKNGDAINTPKLGLIDKTGTTRCRHHAASYRIRPPISDALNEL